MKSLYKIAATQAKRVYKFNIDLGTTELLFSDLIWGGEKIHSLSFCGTNEGSDWLKNGNLWSKKGIKKVAYDAAKEVHEYLLKNNLIKHKVMVNGHSKGGLEAIAYKRLFSAFHCVAFNPPPGIRYWADRKMSDTTIFCDPGDDPVNWAGIISFGHPICTTYRAKNNHFMFDVDDHSQDWNVFIDQFAEKM